jgi:hypothetical protein
MESPVETLYGGEVARTEGDIKEPFAPMSTIDPARKASTEDVSKHPWFNHDEMDNIMRNRGEMTWLSCKLRFFLIKQSVVDWYLLFHVVSQNLHHSMQLIFTLRIIVKATWLSCYISTVTSQVALRVFLLIHYSAIILLLQLLQP